MAKISASCPKCHQPVVVDITRLFDTNTDPDAKKKLLSGSANMVNCPSCGYQGPIPTPIVYHDPEKELLLTYFPPEMGVPFNEQERIIGPLIKKTVDDLPMEKRKAYIFKPQTMLTQQRLFEVILESDGITPEMMKAQQERLNLIQRLAMISEEGLPVAIKQEDAKIDEQTLVLVSQLAQASAAAGDEASARKLVNLQKNMIDNSTFGKQVQEQSKETQKIVTELREASEKGLTRESLLDMVMKYADSEMKLVIIASMARAGMDYGFFQLLSDKIDQSNPEDNQKLTALRTKLLEITQEIDETLKEQTEEAKKMIEVLIAAPNIEEAVQKALPEMSQSFVDVLGYELQTAQKANDTARLEKLGRIAAVLQAGSQSNTYINLIEALLSAPDDAALDVAITEIEDLIDDDFLQFLSGLINQLETQGEQAEVLAKLKVINKALLRKSMQKNLSGS